MVNIIEDVNEEEISDYYGELEGFDEEDNVIKVNSGVELNYVMQKIGLAPKQPKNNYRHFFVFLFINKICYQEMSL